MRILFISLLLLTLVGCAHSNFDSQWPALYYNDSRALADRNRQQEKPPYLYPYTYTIIDWGTASEEKEGASHPVTPALVKIGTATVILRGYQPSVGTDGDGQGTCGSECNSQDSTTSFGTEASMTFEEWVSATSKGTPLREDETVRFAAQVEDDPYKDLEEEDI